MKKKPTKLLTSLMGGEKRRHYVAACVTQEGEWNQHEPNTGFAKMFIAMLILHVLIIGGIILSDSGTKKTAPRSPAAAGMMTKGPDEISGARAASVVGTPAKDDGGKYETYVVRSGDSLPMIVARFGVDQDELVALNGLGGSDFGAGMTLKIPSKKVAAPLQVSAARPLNVGITTPTSTPVAAHTEPQADIAAAVADAPGAAPAAVNAAADASSPPEKSAADVVLTSATDGGNGLVPLPEVAAGTSSEPAVEPLRVEESPPPASSKPEPSSKSDTVVSSDKEKEKDKPAAKKPAVAVAAPRPVPPPSEMTKRPINKTDKSDSPPKTTAKSEAKSSKTSYTMAKGDTLYRVSAKYGVSVESLMKANNVKDPAKLRDGTKLVIPSKQ